MSSSGKEKQKSLQVRCTSMALELASSHLLFFSPSALHPGLLDPLMTEL